MKPNWSDAPEWAKYLALDESGVWCWYEKKPTIMGNYWDNSWNGQRAVAMRLNWRDTLELRPLDSSTSKV